MLVASICFQLRQQFLKILAVAQGLEVGVLFQVRGVLVAGLDGFLQELHRPVGVFLLLVGDLAAGHGINAGEVVPFDRPRRAGAGGGCP